MKTIRIPLLLMLILTLILSLSTCRPATYYLEQVCKVYGVVTVQDSEQMSPISSVEVVVNDYEYSELTNCDGRYEMELPEGTWTITFKKDGYEEQSKEVSVSLEEPAVDLNVQLLWLYPPSDMNGYWMMSAQTPDGTEEHGPFYFNQEESSLRAYGTGVFLKGTILDPVVTLELWVEGELLSWAGILQADGAILFDPADPFESVRLLPCDLDLAYGELYLNNWVSLLTDRAQGIQYPDEIYHDLEMELPPAGSSLAIRFTSSSEIGPGTYIIGDSGTIEAWAYKFLPVEEEWEAESGQLSIGGDGVSGSFQLQFPDGDFIDGSFNVEGPDYSRATVSISAGKINGIPLEPATASNLYFSNRENVEREFEIFYFDDDRVVSLGLQPWSMPIVPGDYSLPDEMSMGIRDIPYIGDRRDCEAESGKITITEYIDGLSISGYFDSVQTEYGSISGSFEVPLVSPSPDP